MNLPRCFLNPPKIPYLQVPAVRSSTAELCDVWKVLHFACYEPFNYWFHLMILNSCIRIDHKEQFSTSCLFATFHLLCLSFVIFCFPSQKVLIGLAVSHLVAVSCLRWLLLLSPGHFFISTLFFSKQKDQTAPSFQDAGKSWIYAAA